MALEGNVQPNLGGEQSAPQDSAPPLSFRDRAAQRLGEERNPRTDDANFDGAPSNLNQAELPEQDAPQDAHQPIEGYPEDSIDPAFDETTEQSEDTPAEGVDDSNVEGEPDNPEITGLRQRAEEAEERVASMQTDYTQKTQKLGEQRRELAKAQDLASKISATYAQRANQNLARYDGVNWQQLQSTLDPQVYSQRVGEYRQAVSIRDRAAAEHDNISKLAEDGVEQRKRDQADISRDILNTTISGWGNELYGTLREHAVNNLQLTGEEFDDIVDHRHMILVYKDWKISNAGQTVGGITQHGNQPRPQGGNKPRPTGGDGGRFRKAQNAHEQNPGDRNATRSAFEERLKKERRGR